MSMAKFLLLTYVGDYQFIEVKAPKDYTLGNDPIPFTIGKSQKKTLLLLLLTA